MRLGMLLVLGSLVGCASDATDGSSEPATTPPPISRGVSLGGAQDIAEFRRIVAEGSVPAPETLDPVGFFAEHAIDLPPATCRGDVCMHPMLAVAPRFNGDNWTMAYLPLNTAVDPTELARPPLHLVIALEQSRNLLSLDTDAALRSLAEGLRAGDRLSFLVFGERPRVLLDGLDPDPSSLDALDAALRESRRDPRDGTSIAPSTTVGLYEGLARASELATELRGMDGAARVVLISSGQGTGALDTPERLTELAAAYGAQGLAYSVVAAGSDIDTEALAAIGDLGLGTFAVAEDEADLERILRSEGQTSLFPLATEFELRLEPADGYRVGNIVGARRAKVDGTGVSLLSPALFIGQRTSSTDVGSGRRGGGSGLFVELIADEPGGAAGEPAFTATSRYRRSDGTVVESSETIVNALPRGAVPEGMWPSFSDPERGKAFMMLNMFLGLQAAVQFYDDGDCARSLGVVDMLSRSVEGWQAQFNDPDIEADFDLLLDLRAVVDQQCQAARAVPVPPVEPVWSSLGCMLI